MPVNPLYLNAQGQYTGQMRPQAQAQRVTTDPFEQLNNRFAAAGLGGIPSYNGIQARPLTAAQRLQNLSSQQAPFAPRLNNAPNDFLNTFFQANERSLGQFQMLMNQYAGPLRDLVLQSSPELAQTSAYLQQSFAEPIPAALAQDYREQIRQTQISRGFAGQGADSTSQAESLALLKLAEDRRQNLLPQLQQFGTGILGMTGLAGPAQFDPSVVAQLSSDRARTTLGLAELAQSQYQFQQQQQFAQIQFEEGLRREQEQSDFARQQFMLTQQQIHEMQAAAKQKTYLDLIEEHRTAAYKARTGFNPNAQGTYQGYNTYGSMSIGPGTYRGFNLSGSRQGLSF